MADLTPFEYDGQLVVDSRLIAEELGIDHQNFMQTIYTYQTQAEKEFGVYLFQTDKPPQGSKGGRPQKYVLLTEDQSTFLMTLSTNTDEVVQCKIKLVKAFIYAKELLRRKAIGSFNNYTLSRIAVHHSDLTKPLPDGYFCLFDKMIEVLQKLDIRLGYQLGEEWFDNSKGDFRYLEPDISLGKLFSSFFTSNYQKAFDKYQEKYNARLASKRIRKFWSDDLIELKWRSERLFIEQNLRYKHFKSIQPLSEDPLSKNAIDRCRYVFKPSPQSRRSFPPDFPPDAFCYSNDYTSVFYDWMREIFFKYSWRDYIIERDNDGWMRRYNTFQSLPDNDRNAILSTSEGGLIAGFEYWDIWQKQLPPSG